MMECALCGAEWADRPPFDRLLTHSENEYSLSPVSDITAAEVAAINIAIRQARQELLAEGKEKV